MVKTAKGVLVRTPTPNVTQGGAGAWSDSSSNDDDDDDDDDDDLFSDMEDGNDDGMPPAQQQQSAQHGGIPAGPQAPIISPQIERAYWLRRTLRAAIYGQVRYGIVLHKLNPPIQVMLPTSSEWVSVEWEETGESVAVKEMSWEHIRAQRDRLAEDPIKEVAAMQYLSTWLQKEHQRLNTMQFMQQLGVGGNLDMDAQLAGMNLNAPLNIDGGLGFNTGNNAMGNNQWIGQQQQLLPALQNLPLPQTPPNMIESHIMWPMDLLSDDRNLYSVMPYCTGGELFDILEKKNRFSELEARYWMRQILKVSYTIVCKLATCYDGTPLHYIRILTYEIAQNSYLWIGPIMPQEGRGLPSRPEP